MSFRVGSNQTFDELQNAFELSVPDVSQEIASGEGMAHEHLAHYFGVGEGVIRLIKMAMLASRKRPDAVRCILDLPCGHGRVLRTLRAAFPDARITAADLLADGVAFCAKTFDAIPVYSQIHPTPEMFPDAGKYDLIFVGSLFTHFDAPRWSEFLSLFNDLLAPGGILLFTTHGPFVAYRMAAGESYGFTELHHPAELTKRNFAARFLKFGRKRIPDDPASGPNKAIQYMVDEYQTNGFGYLDDGTGYGISVSYPSWTLNQIENHPDFRMLYYLERGWDNHQDAVAVIKAPFTTIDSVIGHPFLDDPYARKAE